MDGGGASVRHRSEVISIVGAFLLIADYIVTAALSALTTFQYLGWPYPEVFAAGTILLIGALNFFGLLLYGPSFLMRSGTARGHAAPRASRPF